MIKNLFKRDVIKLTLGTSLGQMIAIFSAPILSRYFSPEAFGLSALFFSIIGLLSVIICLRYENAIIVSTEKESANLLIISLISSLIISLILLFVVTIYKNLFISFFNNHNISNYIYLLPFLLFLAGVYNSLNSWLIRKRQFSIISIGGISNQIATTSSSLYSGVMGQISGGSLILASFIGQLLLNIIFTIKVIINDFYFIKNNVTKLEIKKSIIKYKKFPIYGSFGALINAASWQFPVIMLGYFFSNSIIGFYSLGFRLLQLPMSIIGNSIGQVFFQRGSSISSNLLTDLVSNTFKKLFIISIIPSIILAFTGPDIFQFVFGTSWREAGVYVQILAPWTFFWFISSPLAWIYTIKQKQKEELYIHTLIFLSRLFSILIGGYFFTPRITMVFFSTSGIIIYSFLLYKIFIYSDIKIFNLFLFIKNQLFYIITFTILMLLSAFVLKLNFMLIIILSLMFLFYYYYLNKSILK